MANIERRRPSRRELAGRAYHYGLATAGTALATVLAIVVSFFTDIVGFGSVFVLALLTALFGYLFKRTVSRR